MLLLDPLQSRGNKTGNQKPPENDFNRKVGYSSDTVLLL